MLKTCRLQVPNLPPTLKCKQSIADYLAGHKNMGITSRFISGHASASLFGRSPRGSLVFFAPTDAAWERAAIRLSASPVLRLPPTAVDPCCSVTAWSRADCRLAQDVQTVAGAG